MTSKELITALDLREHPEGGYFRETYRAAGKIFPAGPADGAAGARCFSTAIYFLLDKGGRSRLHRIKSDEVWHFYLGGPLRLIEISPGGAVGCTTMGHDIGAGQVPQHAVPAGFWFGAYLPDGSEYALVGCTVAPGFDFKDFEMGERAALLKAFPAAAKAIEFLT